MVQSFHYFSSNHRALLRKADYSRNKHAMLTLDAYGSHLMESIQKKRIKKGKRRGRKREEEDNRRRRARKEKEI